MNHLDSEWNEQFKVPAHEFKHKHYLKQAAGGEVVLKGTCPVSLQVDTRTNLYMLLYGYMQGLYSSENYPQAGCTRCQNLALPFSQMFYGMSNVLNLFTDLIKGDSFNTMSDAEQLSFLYSSYLIFWEFGSNFDFVLNDTSTIIQFV